MTLGHSLLARNHPILFVAFLREARKSLNLATIHHREIGLQVRRWFRIGLPTPGPEGQPWLLCLDKMAAKAKMMASTRILQ